jgi:hypothetical protein
MADTVDTADMAVATAVDIEGTMVAMEEAIARVPATVSPAVPVSGGVSADLAHQVNQVQVPALIPSADGKFILHSKVSQFA